MNMARHEAVAGNPEQGIGPAAPALTSEQVCNIGFAVLRRYDDDKLWRALTYETGPYDLTMANRPLQELGAAFYAAGYAAGGAQAVDKANSYIVDNARLAEQVESLRAEVAQARQTAEYWKAQHLAGNVRIGELHDEADARKPCTCDGAGRGPGRECVVKAGGRLGDLWRCADGLGA